jgi:hypothetical protein
METRKEEITVYEKTVKIRPEKKKSRGKEYQYGIIVLLLPKETINKKAFVKVYVLEDAKPIQPATQPQRTEKPAPLPLIDLTRFDRPVFPHSLLPIEDIDILFPLDKKKLKTLFGEKNEAKEG